MRTMKSISKLDQRNQKIAEIERRIKPDHHPIFFSQ